VGIWVLIRALKSPVYCAEVEACTKSASLCCKNECTDLIKGLISRLEMRKMISNGANALIKTTDRGRGNVTVGQGRLARLRPLFMVLWTCN